ncbi:MAG: transposase [Anaerolineales bacterium]|nr:transposase [Anaerolineales bacterium]
MPKVEPLHIEPPTRCPYPDPKNPKKKCNGTHFKAHQWNCCKPIRDTRHHQVTTRRYRCLKCQRTFRVYPAGVSHDQQSDTLKGLSVLLYVLGLSYQGVADLLEALQYPLAKSTVYKNVQAAGYHAIQLREQWLKQQAGKVKVLGLDFTHVKCQGQNRIVAVATAVLTGQPLTFELLDSESAFHAERWIRGIAKLLGAEVLVTDDADGLKNVAESLGLDQQICRAHVNRNVEDLIAALGTQALEHPHPVPPELHTRGMTADQFLEDLSTVESIICGVPFDGQSQLARLVDQYQYAPAPAQGHRASMWYRFRRLVLDWSENWARLSLYQRWRGEQGERLDGTNNVTEQVIGQCVKERYRTMRGYKRDESILNISSLIGWIRTQGHDYDLSPLIAC